MSSRRTKGGSLVAILVALLLGLGALVSPAGAVTARSVSLAASPAATFVGTGVKFSGRVTRSPKGSVVRLQRKAGARWVTVASTRTTTSTGAYAVRVTLPKIAAVYSYRAVAPGTSKLATASSRVVPVTALRRTSVTLAPSPAGAVNPGVSKLLVGKVSPFVAGTTAYVQRLSGSTWLTVTTVIVGTDGSISRSVTPGSATTSYRVVVARAGLNAAGTSPTVVVTVNQPPKITTASLPEAGQNLAYTPALTATGKPGTWTVSSGSLPDGIALSSAGKFSGKTSVTGSFPITVKYTETSTGLFATKALTLVVKAFVITTTSLPNATRNAQYPQQQLTKAGGNAGTWSVTAGTLPQGLSLSSAGVLSGLPVAHTGDYTFTVTFTETGTARTASKAFTLTVAGADVAITTLALTDATRLTPYELTLAKTGGSGTWAYETTPLPGLSLNATTGKLSGTPAMATGTYPVTFSFTETSSKVKVTKALTLKVVGEDVSITTASLPEATRTESYSVPLGKTGGPGTWSSTALPTGLTLNPTSGLLSGTPGAHTGSYDVTITFTETGGMAASRDYQLVVGGEDLDITTSSLGDGVRGTAYVALLEKTGGAGTWSASGLPAGITVDTSTGALSGTPVGRPKTYGVSVTFTETATGLQVVKSLNLTLTGEDIAVTTSALPDGTTQTAYSLQLTKTGLDGTWSALSATPAGGTSASTPSGLSISSSGLLAGTPTQAGDWYLTVKFNETASGLQATRVLYLHVSGKNAPEITTASLPVGTVGNAYSADLSSSPQGTWSKVDGTLPPGLSLNGGNGRISGTPTQAGDFTFIVKTTVLLGLGGTNTKRFTIHVDPAP
ncbi:MAG: putative Ig domain-containing protein [Nocardioidaceae bacterium]|nr:putative Ig domain-containing protein [Nocardioidaceae bacterium]